MPPQGVSARLRRVLYQQVADAVRAQERVWHSVFSRTVSSPRMHMRRVQSALEDVTVAGLDVGDEDRAVLAVVDEQASSSHRARAGPERRGQVRN